MSGVHLGSLLGFGLAFGLCAAHHPLSASSGSARRRRADSGCRKAGVDGEAVHVGRRHLRQHVPHWRHLDGQHGGAGRGGLFQQGAGFACDARGALRGVAVRCLGRRVFARPNSAICWSKVAQFRPILAVSGQHPLCLSTFSRYSQTLAHSWSASAKFGRQLPNMGQRWPTSATFWSKTATWIEAGPNLGLRGNCSMFHAQEQSHNPAIVVLRLAQPHSRTGRLRTKCQFSSDLGGRPSSPQPWCCDPKVQIVGWAPPNASKAGGESGRAAGGDATLRTAQNRPNSAQHPPNLGSDVDTA